MGCVVNGPGEAREADLGIAAGRGQGPPVREGPGGAGRARGRDGRRRSSPTPSRSWRTASTRGIAAADVGAEAEAEATRVELLATQGVDANHAEEHIERIRVRRRRRSLGRRSAEPARAGAGASSRRCHSWPRHLRVCLDHGRSSTGPRPERRGRRRSPAHGRVGRDERPPRPDPQVTSRRKPAHAAGCRRRRPPPRSPAHTACGCGTLGEAAVPRRWRESTRDTSAEMRCGTGAERRRRVSAASR